ncbi:DNA replication/repair protein RecF [bacterium]|nr:DNA replication/repair protein RecF [bacterium]
MNIQKLTLKNFRNYSHQVVECHPHFNVIIGPNAQGKTNLLEAVHYLGFLNSFRTSTRHEFVKKNETDALIEADLIRDAINHHIKITLTPHHRDVRLDGKKPQLYRDYYGLIPILLFEPRDVYLFRDSPSKRRRAINKALFLDNPLLLKTIADYDKIVEQKNKVLKEGWGDDQLDVWNEKLAALGASLIAGRLEWIAKMNSCVDIENTNLGGVGKMQLRYNSMEGLLPHMEEKEIYTLLVNQLAQRKNEEKRRRESVVGPHRDDWLVMLDDRDVGVYGSQGENRTSLIALKAAQVTLYEQKWGFPPLFLLDDVASELDPERQKRLFERLSKSAGQVFLTTTKPKNLEGFFDHEGTSFLVEEGHISVLAK